MVSINTFNIKKWDFAEQEKVWSNWNVFLQLEVQKKKTMEYNKWDKLTKHKDRKFYKRKNDTSLY